MENLTKERIGIVSGAVLAIAAVVGGSIWFSSAVAPDPEPTPAPYRLYEPAPQNDDLLIDRSPDNTVIEEEVAPQEVVAPAAPVEPEAPAAPTAPEQPSTPPQTPQQPAPVPQPQPEPEPAPVPVLCPGGSTSMGSDGFNDTACLPDVCFSLTLPDPAHPECDAPFRP